MASTRPAHGSFNAKKSCKNRLISIGHCCSTLVEGSSRPVFGLRLALQPPVSASNDGIISFPKENQWFALRIAEHTSPKSATWAWFVGPLALQIGVKSDHLAAAWAFKIVATAMRAEQWPSSWVQAISQALVWSIRIMFWGAGGRCAIKKCKRIRGERYLTTHQLTLPYLTLPYLTLN